MEVMCHGLNLSLKEHEAIKNCVHVYCEWLVALIPDEAKVSSEFAPTYMYTHICNTEL